MTPQTGDAEQTEVASQCEAYDEEVRSMCALLQQRGATRISVVTILDDGSITSVDGFSGPSHATSAQYAIAVSNGEGFFLESWPQVMSSAVGQRRDHVVRWDVVCHAMMFVEAGFIGSTHEAYVDRWDPDLDEVHCWTAGTRSGKDLQAIEPVDSMKYRPILVAVQPSGEYRLYRGRRARLHAGMDAKRPRGPVPNPKERESADVPDTPE